MNAEDVGEVIATRKLCLYGDDTQQEILVLIGKPVPFEDLSGYYCPFQIRGMGDEKIRNIAGVDAIQSIELVMNAIGTELYLLNEVHNGKLRWVADDSGDLGFPIPL